MMLPFPQRVLNAYPSAGFGSRKENQTDKMSSFKESYIDRLNGAQKSKRAKKEVTGQINP